MNKSKKSDSLTKLKLENSQLQHLVCEYKKEIAKLQSKNAKHEATKFSLQARISALIKQQKEIGPSFSEIIKAAHKLPPIPITQQEHDADLKELKKIKRERRILENRLSQLKKQKS